MRESQLHVLCIGILLPYTYVCVLCAIFRYNFQVFSASHSTGPLPMYMYVQCTYMYIKTHTFQSRFLTFNFVEFYMYTYVCTYTLWQKMCKLLGLQLTLPQCYKFLFIQIRAWEFEALVYVSPQYNSRITINWLHLVVRLHKFVIVCVFLFLLKAIGRSLFIARSN